MKKNYDTYIRSDGWLMKVFHTFYIDAMGKRTPVILECQSGDSPLELGEIAYQCGVGKPRYYTHETRVDEEGVLFNVSHSIHFNRRGKPFFVHASVNTPSPHALGCYADALIRFYREDQLKKAREENIRELKLI